MDNFSIEVAFVLRKVDKGEGALLKARATVFASSGILPEDDSWIDCEGERQEVRTQLRGFYRKHKYARTHVQRRILWYC